MNSSEDFFILGEGSLSVVVFRFQRRNQQWRYFKLYVFISSNNFGNLKYCHPTWSNTSQNTVHASGLRFQEVCFCFFSKKCPVSVTFWKTSNVAQIIFNDQQIIKNIRKNYCKIITRSARQSCVIILLFHSYPLCSIQNYI